MRGARRMLHTVTLWCLLPFIGACALTSKADPLEIRVFSPQVPVPAAASAASRDPAAPRLDLSRVSAAAHLRKKIVYRRSPLEIGTYETLRWAERPEEYAKRALTAELFHAHGFVRDLSGDAPALEVEVLAFEELRSNSHGRGSDKAPGARVELGYVLHDGGVVLAEGNVRMEAHASSSDPEALTVAIANALESAVKRVAEEVREGLGRK